jgi:hypothetical protein
MWGHRRKGRSATRREVPRGMTHTWTAPPALRTTRRISRQPAGRPRTTGTSSPAGRPCSNDNGGTDPICVVRQRERASENRKEVFAKFPRGRILAVRTVRSHSRFASPTLEPACAGPSLRAACWKRGWIVAATASQLGRRLGESAGPRFHLRQWRLQLHPRGARAGVRRERVWEARTLTTIDPALLGGAGGSESTRSPAAGRPSGRPVDDLDRHASWSASGSRRGYDDTMAS